MPSSVDFSFRPNPAKLKIRLTVIVGQQVLVVLTILSVAVMSLGQRFVIMTCVPFSTPLR